MLYEYFREHGNNAKLYLPYKYLVSIRKYTELQLNWQDAYTNFSIKRSGACFSKLMVITGPVKLFCFRF